jgi:hypothetical protein
MCHLVVEAVAKGNQLVLADVRSLVNETDYTPSKLTTHMQLPGVFGAVCCCKENSIMK